MRNADISVRERLNLPHGSGGGAVRESAGGVYGFALND